MSDIADLASEREELIRAAALAERKPEGPVATGFCHECGDVLLMKCKGESGMTRRVPDFDRRWCNAECRDMWEKRNR